MKVNHTVSAIMTSHWLVAENAVDGLAEMATLYLQDKLPKTQKEQSPNLGLDTSLAVTDYADAKQYDNVPQLLQDGTLVFPIMGVLMKHDNCWAAGTQTMTNWVLKATSDKAVESVLFLIDSPGGQALGSWEMAQAMAALQAEKPTESLISGYGCSAAYYLAAATGKISVTSPDVMVGSIGVAWGYRQQPDGIKYVYASTSQLKHGASKSLRETGDASLLQSLELDPMHKTFTDFVKAHRPQVSADALAGLEVVASKSIELNTGLIDGIDSLPNTLARMSLTNSIKPMSDNKKFVKMLVPEGFSALVASKIAGAKEVTAEMEAEEVSALNLQVGVQAQQIADLQAELTTAKTTASTLHDSIQTLTAQKATLETEKAELTQALADKDTKISTITAELATYIKPDGKPIVAVGVENEVVTAQANEDTLPGYKPLFKGK